MEFLLFAAFPYIATAVAVAVGLYRYFSNRFSYTSGSTQFITKGGLFWGSVPWHYGIVLVLLAHLLALLAPGPWRALLGEPTRLYVLEITGYALAAIATVGLSVLVWRRSADARLRAVTGRLHWLLLAALLLQVALGLYIALAYRWGSVWYTTNLVPWLWSLAQFNPQLQYLAPLPFLVKFHAFNAFVIVALFPFTRLVHIFTFPITYLWRSYQIAIWNRRGTALDEGPRAISDL